MRRISQQAFEESFTSIEGIKNIHNQHLSNQKLIERHIIREIRVYFDTEKIDIPPQVEGMINRVDYILKNTGVLQRKITLNGTWFLDYREPILAFTKENNIPILLYPIGANRYYYINYRTGKKVKVNYTIANKLKAEAYSFYKPLKKSDLTVKDYFKHFRKSIRPLDMFYVIFMSIITTAIGMFLPYLTKRLTGEVIEEKNMHLFIITAVYVGSASIGYLLIKTFQAMVNSRIAIKMEKTMQEITMMRMLSLETSFFKKYNTGELTMRFNSFSQIALLIFNGLFLTGLSSLMAVAYLTQIVQFASSLVLPVIIILLLTAALSIVVSLRQINVSRKQLLLSSKENGTSYSLINGIQKIRLSGAEEGAFTKWETSYRRAARPLYNPPLLIKIFPALSLMISSVGMVFIYFIASKNNIEVSSFVAFSTSFGILSSASAALSQIGTVFARTRPVLDMAKPILEAKSENYDDKEMVDKLQGNIRLENLTFSYKKDDRKILNGINVEIKEGEYVGIVGKTGCGKSTLVRLLLGFEKPDSGNIYYDDKNINDLNLVSLRRNIGTVLQNGATFHADILSNIIIAAPELGEDEAWEALETAGLANDVRAMPMGLKTVISEGQGGISGGQKQRVLIARAIVNKPKVLIFDEATSALDNKTQRSISEAINKLNCTRIVIAHRLSTIKECDRILYMENGEILEEGNYEELIKLNGKFFELVNRQRITEEE